MNVVFSNTIFFLQKKGGISRYYVNLSRELEKIKVKSKIIAPINKNIYLKNFNQKNISFYLSRFPNNFFFKKLSDILFDFFLRREKPDIIHETYYNKNNLDTLKNTVKVVTIYDLAHEKFSKFYTRDKILQKKKILSYADHFICISKKTQIDFIKYYKISPKKTSVIYLGCDHLRKNKETKSKLVLPKKYFLYVGERENYKNFKILAKAFNSSKKFQNVKIICFGGEKFSQDEIKRYNLDDNFINLQGDDSLLAHLYTKALALVNTSKYEGFGITNVEAMHLGCPVISSNFITLREIGNNSCLYFKSNNKNDLVKKMEFIFLNKNFRKILIKRGHKRSKIFTWYNCARNTKKLYYDLLKKD